MRRSVRLPAWLLALLLPLSAALAGPPDEPSIVTFDQAAGMAVGHPGGELSSLIAKARDVRMMVVFGYARLVGYQRDLTLAPDLLKAIEVDDGRRFTMHLRKGHRWSDGAPFTAEDFRYWWEDVANNPQLNPTGPPSELLVDGKPPTVEFPDPLTVRYSWPGPNPAFLPALAGARPLFIYMPAHYLRQFHARYADPAELEKTIKQDNAQDWAQLHGRRDGMYSFDNPDLPTLQPWRPMTAQPATRFVFERNPYYHRVDSQGQQLPYIDRIHMDVVDSNLIPIKAGAGEADLQARGLYFKHYTFLKDSEGRSGLVTLLWRTAQGAHLALYPNLNAGDPTWRAVFRDVRCRRALSLGINREEINQILFYGLAIGGNNTVLPDSPLYREEYRFEWAGYDPARANALLDEMGLTERNDAGLRLLPDGRPMELVVDTAGEDTEQSDVLELVADNWLQLGIKIHTKPSQIEVFRNRIFSGASLMSIAVGLDNGLPTADMSPWEFAPTDQFSQYQWPSWGQHFQTSGAAGEAPALPEAKALLALFQDWNHAPDHATRNAVWHEMLKIYGDEVFTIGLVGGVLQPIAARRTLRNLPTKAVYNWEPGAHFGIYRPDTFWFDNQAAPSQ